MKGCFIINPQSGLSATRDIVYLTINRLLAENVVTSLNISVTQGKYDATNIAASLDPEECDFVVSVGGDGTANEVVNGLVKSGSKIPLAILPFGTTNDFAASLSLPKDSASVVSMIKSFRVEPVDVGMFYTKDRNKATYFLNVVAGGLLSSVAHTVPVTQKNAFGRLAYLVEGAKNLTGLTLETSPLIIDCDGDIYHEDTFMLEISNSTSAGGFTKIAPGAYINDGLFNLFLVRKVGALDVMPLLTKISTGMHVDDSRILMLTGKKITVSPDLSKDFNSFPMDYDGEKADDIPATIEVLPGAINLIVPDKKHTEKIVRGFKRTLHQTQEKENTDTEK